MGESVDKYRPKKARKHMQGKLTVKPRIDRWVSHDDPADTSFDMLPWSIVFSPRLEPKHQSLLWLVQQGAVATARVTRHFLPSSDSDADPSKCPVCKVHHETLRHYFFECPRVRDFWRMIGGFLDRIQMPPATQPTGIELNDVLSGLPSWKDKIPSLLVLYALAMWQIYRSHTECAQENIRIPAITMFARWQSEVVRRIQVDLYNAKCNNNMDRFKKNWLDIRCQWFVFDSGGGVPWRSHVVFNRTIAAPPRLLTLTDTQPRSIPHIIQTPSEQSLGASSTDV